MAKTNPLAERIESRITPSLRDMGYAVVRVMVHGDRRPVLQVMAERIDERAMTVDDCAEISRSVSALLDVEDPISGAYTLEVSSPGIDRPLVRMADFQRFAGHRARIELRQPVDGRRRFRGRLLGVEAETVRVEIDGAPLALPFAVIDKAKLELTDELLREAKEHERP